MSTSSTARTRSSSTPKRKPVRTPTKLQKRTFRQVIGRIDVWSVLKLSLCFHTAAMLTTVVTIVVCWWAASAVGIVKNLEKFLGTVFEIKQFSLVDFQVLQGVLMIGIVLVAFLTIISVMAAALYNVFAEAVGGIEIYVVEETSSSRIQ